MIRYRIRILLLYNKNKRGYIVSCLYPILPRPDLTALLYSAMRSFYLSSPTKVCESSLSDSGTLTLRLFRANESELIINENVTIQILLDEMYLDVKLQRNAEEHKNKSDYMTTGIFAFL